MSIISGSLLVDLFGLVTIVIGSIYGFILWRFRYWKNKDVPYLKPKVPFGNFMNPLTKTLSESHQLRAMYLKAKAKGYKYCGIYNMAAPNLMILDLDLLKQVLTKDFSHFTDRGFYHNEKDDPLSAHLFAIGNPKWKNVRSKVSPAFSSGKMKAMFQTLVDTGKIFEDALKEIVTSREPIDVKDVLGRFSTDIIGSVAFGIECNSFKEPNSPYRVYGKRVFIQNKFESLKQAFCHNFPHFSRALGISFFHKEATIFFNKMIKDVVAYREKNNVTRKDFMQLLIDIKNNDVEEDGLGGDGKKLTLDELAAQSFVFFLAGFETSSTTGTFCLFELARQPEIQEKVRQEIKTVLAKHNNEVTYDSLNELKYMKQVIDEALRKYPPIPFITRECVKDYRVPGKQLTIEKGTIVTVPIEAFHYDEEYFRNADAFDPERFSEEKKNTRHAYSHIPFGEGPRICIGERFGIMQTKVALTSILKNYKVKVHEKTRLPLKMAIRSFITSTEGEMWLTFEKI